MEPLRLSRRAAVAGVLLGWLPRASGAEAAAPARSLVTIWLAGGPSQLETFDPHPGTRVAAGTRAIATRAPSITLAEGYEALAEHAHEFALVRSLVSAEADHARATYLAKTGYPPGGGVTHPSLGAIAGRALAAESARLPPQIGLLPSAWPSRGGLLGARFDAFAVAAPGRPVPDLGAPVPEARHTQRLADARFVDEHFVAAAGARATTSSACAAAGARATTSSACAAAARQDELTRAARDLMSAPEARAFALDEEPAHDLARYGPTAFGRACVVARRLVERGARAIEITLDGWDTHTDNHARHRALARTLDPALAALLADLRARDLLRRTVVLCGGEFGRTPTLNAFGGRDHWSRGFSVLVAGGAIRGGAVVGATDPDGSGRVIEPRRVADVHATILQALGVDPTESVVAPSGRPIAYSDGAPLDALLAR